MKTTFKLSNVFGSIYHKGSLQFTPDGIHLMSPVGNKIMSYDLKNNRSQCLGLESEYNVQHMSISPDGKLLLVATEKTQLYMMSMVSQTVLHRKQFHDINITAVSFSPNGQFYVVAGGNKVLVYATPDTDSGRDLSPFKIHSVIKAHFDDINSVSWSPNSLLLAIASKDFTAKIVSVLPAQTRTPRLNNMTGHSDHVVGSFFSGVSGSYYDFFSLSRTGHLLVFEATFKESEDILGHDEGGEVLHYSRTGRHFLLDHLKDKPNVHSKLTAVEYNHRTRIMVTGYSNGCFLLQDIPDLNIIYSLQLSNNSPVESLVMNVTGEWIAIGSGLGEMSGRDPENLGTTTSTQLVVWEWRTETFVMKQSGTGAGVANLTECSAFSPDGLTLATGGTDAKVRRYDTMTGFCFVTFGQEHRGPVTALEFISKKGGKVLVSASLDGTVRCFDLNRYRNFKTFSAGVETKAAQFTCMAVDTVSGDFIAAGAQNTFDIYMWSIETGRLVEVLSGHTAPVSGVKFSPAGSELISCSWDQTVRIWGLFQATKSSRESIQVTHDCISLAVNATGTEIAVSTINGQIYFFNTSSGEQLGVPIAGKSDLGVSITEDELSRDTHKYFTSLAFSADGEYVLAGGNSKHICLYHKQYKMLVKKFQVTFNKSMDGMFDYISKRKRAEFGFNQSLIRSRLEGEYFAEANLPGVRRGDLSERSVNPIISVTDVSFSPTMRSFVATTTEGVLLFSLDSFALFDPFGLEVDVTEDSIRTLIRSGEYLTALLQAVKLNQRNLVQEVFESVPPSDVSFIASSIPVASVESVLRHIALCLESSRHLEFYVVWANEILKAHAIQLKNNQGKCGSLMAVLRLLSRTLNKHFEAVGKLVDMSHHSLQLISCLSCQ